MADIVFMGTPDFAVPTLTALIEHQNVIGVVTQPDRPAGRKRQIQPSPVKQLAVEHDIPVFQPQRLRDAEASEILNQWRARYLCSGGVWSDFAAGSAGYSHLWLIECSCFTVAALAWCCPRFRQRSALATRKPGVTIMKMDAGS